MYWSAPLVQVRTCLLKKISGEFKDCFLHRCCGDLCDFSQDCQQELQLIEWSDKIAGVRTTDLWKTSWTLSPLLRGVLVKIILISKQNLTDLSILRCNKLSTNISSGWLAFYDLGTKKSFKKLGKFMALVTFEVTN